MLRVQGVAISSAIVIAAPSQAAPVTQARFLHAVAGAPPAVLVVEGHPPRLASSYGKPSVYHACNPGPARLVLRVRGQSEPAATKRIELGRGKYTVIAVSKGKRVDLRAYQDNGAVRPGRARVRAIHAAAEIDRADVRVDGRVVSPALRPGAATRYASFAPGRHNLAITRPGGRGGALLSEEGVPLVAGTASSAIVVGSRGMPTEFLLVSDGAAGPATAPATGFVGDVSEDSDWLLVLGAALLAGSLGGAAYVLAVRRGAGGAWRGRRRARAPRCAGGRTLDRRSRSRRRPGGPPSRSRSPAARSRSPARRSRSPTPRSRPPARPSRSPGFPLSRFTRRRRGRSRSTGPAGPARSSHGARARVGPLARRRRRPGSAPRDRRRSEAGSLGGLLYRVGRRRGG